MRALLLMILLVGSAARASCSRTSCFCLDDGTARSSSGTLEVSVLRVNGARTEFSVETVRGATGGLTARSTLALPRQNGDEVGQRWLLFFANDAFHVRMRVAGGTVTCGEAVSVEDASNLFSLADCQSATEARRLVPPCLDSGNSCSSGGAPALALVMLGLRLRRRVCSAEVRGAHA